MVAHRSEVLPSTTGLTLDEYNARRTVESGSTRSYAEAQVAGTLAVRSSLEARDEFVEREGWKLEGNCSDVPPATFFASNGGGVDAARKICSDCPVKRDCLEYALFNRIDHGVWGGTSERERRRILRQRRLQKAMR